MLTKTITQQTKVKDPYCMLALAVIQRASRDNDQEFFESDGYCFWLDFISICLGVNLSYDLRPVGE